MRKISIICAALIWLAAGEARGQRTCASYDHLLEQLAQHPEMAQQRANIEQFTQNYIQQNQLPQNKTTTAIYTIPVVVHVLYHTTAQNISDAQILSQIDILNADFQKLNSDASLTPAAFAGLTADCQISFCMAQRDPQGNATNGILRKSTAKTSFSYTADDAKHNSTGGDDAWPMDQYLNLWVVPAIGGGVLGYAQFPGGPAATDGVVIAHIYFGNTGTAAAPFNLGRTATHEVGHWLNLYHIWGDDGNACSGSDLVGDTPNQGDENYGCPSFPTTSCSNGPNGDMFMNYMDYTDDACMYMFTAGQKTRMHAVLTTGGARNLVTTSLGCTPVVTCAAPSGLNASAVTTSGATLNWAAASGATGYNLQWKATAASTWTTVSNLTGTSYNLSGLASNTSYSYMVQTKCSGTSTSSYSSAASFTTSSVAACNVPAALNATAITSSGATLNWTGSAGVANYELQWKLSNATTWNVVSNISATSYTLSGLSSSSAYKYKVRAHCASGNYTAFAATAMFTTLHPPCNPPAGLNAITGTTTAVLTWHSIPGIIDYTLQWKTGSGSWVTVANVSDTFYNLSGLPSFTNFSFKVKVNCDAKTSSAYSAVYSFATAGPCSNSFEPNESLGAALSITPGASVVSMIATSTDKDYFKFSNTTTATNIRVSLDNLPANYDLKLYKGTTLLATSANTGTTAETIIYNTNVQGAYKVYVYGNSGAFSNSACYTLKAEISSTSFREASGAVYASGHAMTLYPNPAANEVKLDYFSSSEQKATVGIIDQGGRLCLNREVELKEGANTISLDINAFPAGIYYVRFVTTEEASVIKLVIAR